jgi:hypothetical protein
VQPTPEEPEQFRLASLVDPVDSVGRASLIRVDQCESALALTLAVVGLATRGVLEQRLGSKVSCVRRRSFERAPWRGPEPLVLLLATALLLALSAPAGAISQRPHAPDIRRPEVRLRPHSRPDRRRKDDQLHAQLGSGHRQPLARAKDRVRRLPGHHGRGRGLRDAYVHDRARCHVVRDARAADRRGVLLRRPRQRPGRQPRLAPLSRAGRLPVTTASIQARSSVPARHVQKSAPRWRTCRTSSQRSHATRRPLLSLTASLSGLGRTAKVSRRSSDDLTSKPMRSLRSSPPTSWIGSFSSRS